MGAGWAVYSWLKRRNDMSQPCDDPHKLFRELCLAHQLEHRSRRLLLQLAGALDWSHPAELFVTPAAFEPSACPRRLRGPERRNAGAQRRGCSGYGGT